MEYIEIDKNIKIYNNFITDYECEFLLQFAKNADESNWLEIKEKVDENSKLYDLYLQYKSDWDKTTLMIEQNNIIDSIKNRCQMIIDENLIVTSDIYRIKRVLPGRSISPHFDNALDPLIRFGFVIYLNDGFSGGQIYYPNIDKEYHPQAKSMIIHPSDEKYIHGVKEVEGHTRYCLAFFAKYNDLKK